MSADRFSAAPVERIQALVGDLLLTDLLLTEDTTFVYIWNRGIETLTVRYDTEGGRLSYSGVFHPNGDCERNGAGICRWCGV